MREYIYLWIQKYVWLGKDSTNYEHYLFENVGIPLTSKYNVESNFDKNSNLQKLTINVNPKDNNCYNANYFSKHITDLVAIIGKNGCGKSSLLDFLNEALTDGKGNSGFKKFALIYADNKEINWYSNLDFPVEVFYKDSLQDMVRDLNLGTYKSESYKSDFVVFYSTEFNLSSEYFYSITDFFGSADISTKNVIHTYPTKLYNCNLTQQNYSEKLPAYSYYQQQIELNFIGDFLENEKNLPTDLPTYMFVLNNDSATNILKNELSNKKYEKYKNSERWLKIIKKWEEEINEKENFFDSYKLSSYNIRKDDNFIEKTYLSVFACIFRANYNENNPFIKDFDSITENNTIEEAITLLAEPNNMVRSNIVSKLKKIEELIKGENTERKDNRYLIYIVYAISKWHIVFYEKRLKKVRKNTNFFTLNLS